MKLDLDKDWWGWHQVFGTSHEELCRPLTPTEAFPVIFRRGGGSIDGQDWPPWVRITSEFARAGVVNFDLWEGDGYRVGYGDRAGNGGPFIYADSPNVPPEWRAAIGAALKEAAEKWPGVAVCFRPDHDAVPLNQALIDSFSDPQPGASHAG